MLSCELLDEGLKALKGRLARVLLTTKNGG